MVDINEIYKSNDGYIKAEDIGNNMWTFTIRTADVKKFDDGTSKIILTFNEWDKGLPLNVTNARSVADLYGHNSNAWVGRQVMLFSTMANFQGKPVPAIRIRAPMQQQAPMPVPQMGYPNQQPMRQPGQMQPQANTNVGGYGHLQNSPQRPLGQPPAQDSYQPFAPITDNDIQ